MRLPFHLAATLLVASLAQAQDYSAGALIISNPASHSMVPGAKVGDGFVTIRNTGREPDRLLSVGSDRAASVQLHRMVIDNGVMIMRELKEGITIPAGETVNLYPDYHLMFMGVTKPFKQGETIHVTLNFEKAGKLDVDFAVGKVAGPLGAANGQSGDTKSGMTNGMHMDGHAMGDMDMGGDNNMQHEDQKP